MASPRDRLLEMLATSKVDGIEELDPEDVIMDAVIVLRLQQIDEPGSALLIASDSDPYMVIGMLHSALARSTEPDSDD